MRKPTAGRAVSLLAALPLAAMAQPPKPATGTLTITFAAEATMMNPQRSAAGVDPCSIGQMFEQLVRTGPDLKKRGWPAESRQVKEENGNPYVDVHLRKGVEFHNGDPLRTGRTPWPGQPQRDRLRRPPRPRSAARGCTPERLRCALLQPDHAARAAPEGGGEAYFAPATAVGIRCKAQGQEHGTWITFGRRDRQGHIDALHSNLWGHGLPGDPGVAWAGHVHSCVPGAGRGVTAVHHDPELDALIKELKTIMDLGKRDAMITKVARITHERVAGGLPTPRPIATLAWREAKVTFNPWPPPGFWRSL